MKKIVLYTSTLLSILSINKLSSQVVINEIQMQPAGSSTATNPQNLVDCTPNSGAEFIELYNTNQCSSVDISCYILGTNIAGTSAAAHGAFRFPAGTTIPPLGFISIGGINSGATFILNTYCGTQNLAINPAGRWYLPNGDGYMMLYDATGASVDAVYWTTGSTAADQAKWGTDSDINTNPTRIPAGTGGCANIASLPGPANLPIASAEWMGQAAGNGLSCSRQTDGSTTWVNNVAGTVNACNGACVVANTFHVPANVTQPSCSSNNGVITITPSPVGAYTYTWSPNVSSTNTASSLSGGTYSISISSGGCQKDTVITLTAPNAPTNITVNITNASCGQSNGSVTLGAVTGGTAPYQYNFNSLGLSSTTSYNSLAAGNYSLIVSDNNGCTYTAPNVIISNGSAPTAIVVNTVNASCGQSNGSVTLGAVTGGTGPYQYNFNSLGLSSTTTYNSLAAGNYSLIISDNNGCTYTAPTVVISNGSAPTAIVVNTVNASCGQSNGSVTLGAVTGGTGPYQYNFNSLGLSSTTTYNSLAAGNYSLIVSDNNGCNYTAPNVVISNSSAPTSIVVNITNASCGNSNGNVTLGAVTGGTAPYQYNFNSQGLSTITSFTNLAAGTYPLTVSDNNGCVYTAPNVVVNNTNAPTAIIISSINPSCGATNGSINLGAVTGGVAPFQYNFNGLGFNSNTSFSNLAAGNYSLIVQDNNGCQYTAPITNLISPNSPTAVIVTTINATCNGNDGIISIGNVTGGIAPYQYNLNAQGLVSSTQYTNLTAGNYTLVVQDNNGCTYTAPVINVGSSNGPSSIAINNTNATCGNANGTVTLGNVIGGTSPYQYNFNNLGLSSNTSYSGLIAGIYSVTVVDNNGCTYTTSTTLNSINLTFSINTEITEPSCANDDGKININNVNGGMAPYQYNFNNNGFLTTPLYENLSNGNYNLIVKDNNGCTNSFDLLVPLTADESTLYTPNCFTPNFDDVNEFWKSYGTCILEYKCYIFNRWGEKIATLNSIDEKWDGTYKGKIVSDGIYVYVIEATDARNLRIRKSGHITLLR